jgi:hypothetical protein
VLGIFTVLTLDHIAKAASALHASGQAAVAADFWNAAIEASPHDPALLTALAVTLRALKQPADAETALRRAIAIEPTGRRRNILACALHDQLWFADAEEELRRALELDPTLAGSVGLLGIWLLEKWHYRDTTDDPLCEAIDLLARAIELAPGNLDFAVSRVSALMAADRLDDVIADASRLIEQHPTIPEFHVHRAAARMKLGQLAEGYTEFGTWAYRIARVAQNHAFMRFRQWNPDASRKSEISNPKSQTDTSSDPRRFHFGFDASDLDLSPKGDVYVWNVEGAGDHFHFIRFASAMAREGWTVKAIANKTMDRLLARVPGVAAVIGEDAEIPEDAVLASLPMLPAAYVGLVPLWEGRYMSVDQTSVNRWREQILSASGASDFGFGAYPPLRVGLAWAGNPLQCNDERRSFDVGCFTPLFGLSGVDLISLQHGQRGELTGMPILDLGDDFENGDWTETAAVIANLDLVIAPCTAVAHLAGAMDKPVWLALSEPCCWRWMQKRTDSPWYPTMRIFRQRVRGSWDGVFESMAAELGRKRAAA